MFFFTRRRARPFAGFLGCGIFSALLRRRRLALAGDAHPARALAAARVGLGPLAAGREAAAVAQAAVGADLHQPFDVLRALAAKVSLHLALLDRLTQADDLVLGQVFDQGVGVDLGFREDLLRGRAADAEDIGEADFDPLLNRDVD